MHPVSRAFRRLAVSAAAVVAVAGSSSTAFAEPIVGLLQGNRLVTFDSATPGATGAPVALTGILAGTSLIGLDLRPSTGVLYGLGGDGSLYSLNSTTGAASFLGGLSVGLSGTAFGIDFNPVPDLVAGSASLRITSNTGQNLRVNVNAGLIGQATVDTSLNGNSTGFVGSAYTNNDRDPATATALYGIIGNALFQQTVPNAGTTVLVGGLGLTTSEFTGFDVSATGASFASLTAPGAATSGFYSINLGSGLASLLGTFGSNLGPLVDITAATVPANVAAVAEPETYALMLGGLSVLGWAARRKKRVR